MTLFIDWRERPRPPRQCWFDVTGGSLHNRQIEDMGLAFVHRAGVGPSTEIDGVLLHYETVTETYVRRRHVRVAQHPCIRNDRPLPFWIQEDFDINGPYVTDQIDRYVLESVW